MGCRVCRAEVVKNSRLVGGGLRQFPVGKKNACCDSHWAVGKGETGRDTLCSVQVRGSACLSTTVRATDYLR